MIAISWTGFLAFLVFGQVLYCKGAEPRPWCSWKVPNIYSFVQDHYWNVGLFRYFTLSQLPNFCLAAPLIIFCMSCIWKYCSADWKWSAGLGLSRRTISKSLKKHPFYCRALLPHIYLLAFMLAYGLLVVHVQVINRLFTFMPVIYWYQAHLYSSASGRHARIYQFAHLVGIGLFAIVSSVLFFAYYPPA